MKKFFLISFLGISAIFPAACGNDQADENANSNVNAAAAQSNEVAIYTDAALALSDGNKFLEANQLEKAIDAYKQAVKLNPDLAESHFKLGVAYALLESEQELIATPAEPTETDEKTDSKSKDKKEDKSNSVIAFENAVTAYKKILKENPKDDTAHFYLGRAYERLNEDKESRKAFEQAVKLKPEDTQYQTEFGAILIKLAQYDEAVRALKKAVEIDEANAQAQELLEKAEAGKKRVDFGADKLKDSLKIGQEPPKPGKTAKDDEDSDKDNSNVPVKKEPEKKEAPKATPNQPKKPFLSNPA
jgi:tetratricopeptide (TPR) repeat protein